MSGNITPHPRQPRILVAYTWFGLHAAVPGWLVDNDRYNGCGHPRLYHRIIDPIWGFCRAHRIIHLNYWGRTRQ